MAPPSPLSVSRTEAAQGTLRLPLPPTRAEALRRLHAFVPKADEAYARRRNLDLPGHPHVSGLSPWIRRRLVTEAEVLAAVQTAHPGRAAKFRAEVLWRTYWKGWLEARPGVWRAYQRGVVAGLDRVQTEAGLRAGWEAACKGETGIAAFDHWAQELATTGYVHNHARMWFASIWIFTLRLPWELGADFFLRHLLDGDPAANTLSWRWVAGLHTEGKHYVATASNIEKNTEGRFRPDGLAIRPQALPFQRHPPARSPDFPDNAARGARAFLLVHDDDAGAADLWDRPFIAAAGLTGTTRLSPLQVAPQVAEFARGAVADGLERAGMTGAPVFGADGIDQLARAIRDSGADHVATAYAPVGPTADALAHLTGMLEADGIAVIRRVRAHDRTCWPHATRGFFPFREAVMG